MMQCITREKKRGTGGGGQAGGRALCPWTVAARGS